MVPRRLLATTGLAVGFGLIALTHTHSAPAATPQQINAAIDKGMAYTKKRLQAQGAKQLPKGSEQRPVAEAALAGLALLECGLSAEDDTLKRVTAQVREASFSETQTYHLALYILYLDRLGDPADVPIIQMLAVRLLAGQNPQGGWTYGCPGVSESMETMLRNALLTAELRSGQVQPARDRDTAQRPSLPPATDFRRLHPAVARYAGQLQAEYMQRNGGAHHFADDNSNTQFAILGLWAARKHGVPVEAAFNLIEKRFLATQCPDGGWPYSGKGFPGSASMTCVGLLGLATAVGRRQERLLRTDPQALPTPQGKSRSDAGAKKTSPSPDDPFFRPPPAGQPSTNGTDDPFFRPPPTPPPAVKEPNKPAPKKPAGPLAPPLAGDPCAVAIQKGFANLAAVLQGDVPFRGKGKGANRLGLFPTGHHSYYFLWSLERVGVIYGIDKIGNVDWYDYAADILVNAQQADGGWGDLVNSAFALLVLCRSNVVRDLSRVVQGSGRDAELRTDGRASPWQKIAANPPAPGTGTNTPTQPPDEKGTTIAGSEPTPPGPDPSRPLPPLTPPSGGTEHPDRVNPPREPPAGQINAGDPEAIVEELLRTPPPQWVHGLNALKQGKGNAFTQALLTLVHRVEGERKGLARQALAERLTRMTADTLRQYLQASDPELRRAAALAIAMKDDKLLIPDLIPLLLDEHEAVVRAVHAALKSLTGQDFGPAPGADQRARTAAAHAWLDWFRRQRR